MVSRSSLAVFSLVTSLAAAPLLAATFTVNSPSDVNDANAGNGICETAPGNGVCTLRAAIQEANAPGGDDIINLPALPAPNAYVLTLAATLDISSNLTLNGSGAATTIIDGNRALRPTVGVFAISAGTVTMSNVTVRNGGRSGSSSSSFGGGIVNEATLTLSGSTVSGNTALGQGGGIHNTGTLTLSNSAVSGNSSVAGGNPALGGGIFNDVDATLALTNSTVSGNSSALLGGGIRNVGTMVLINTTVSGNTAANSGGGIANGVHGTSAFVNTTVSGNHAGTYGGGIYNLVGTASLFNATVANNRANLNSSFGAGTVGAGIFNDEQGTFSFQNTIIVGNTDFAGIFGDWPDDCAATGTGTGTGTITSYGNNVMGTPYLVAGCSIIGDVITFVDSFGGPYLGPLQDNGGPTQTHALLANNPALNGGPPLGCRDQFGALLTTDQRGLLRPSGANCDAGAFESQDSDSDGVDASGDNCTGVANPTQLDANGDGYGNHCDGDLNNSGLITSVDFNLLRTVLNQAANLGPLAAAADMNGSGTVTVLDYNLLRAALNQPPGPSGLHPNCPPTCP